MPKIPLKPYWRSEHGDVRLYLGNVLDVLRRMPAKAVQCVVSSPPYWGLRDYGTAAWTGGDQDCDHNAARIKGRADYGFSAACSKQATNQSAGFSDYKHVCPDCGAKRIDWQIGSEKVPDCLGWAKGDNCAETDWANGCYVCRMVLVFREVRRVLRDDGVFWLNLGSTFLSKKLESDTMVLRDDLTDEERAYVLRELKNASE